MGVFVVAKFGFHLVHQFCRFNCGNRLQTSPNVEKKPHKAGLIYGI